MIRKINRRFALVLTVFSVLWFFSCGAVPEAFETVLSERAVIMEPGTLAKLQSLDDDGTLTFTGLSQEETPKAGDILIAAPSENAPYGFLLKVTEVQQKEGSTVILTEEASIADVIVSGEVSFDLNLNDQIDEVFDEDDNPLEYETVPEPVSAARTAGRAASGVVTGGNISFPVNVPVFQGVSLKGNVTLGNSMLFDMKVSGGVLQAMTFTVTNKTALALTLNGEYENAVQLAQKKTLGKIQFRPQTVMVGPVPLTFCPVVYLYLNAGLTGKIAGQVDLLNGNYTVTTGFAHRNGTTTGIFQHTAAANEPGGSVLLSGTAGVSLEPLFVAPFMNMKDISISLGADLYGRAEVQGLPLANRYNADPVLTGTVGADAKVTGKFKVFGFGIADYNASVPVFEKQVFEASLFPRFAPLAFSDITDTSATARARAETPEHFFAMFPVSQYGLCLGTGNPPAITDTTVSHTSQGSLPASWTAVSAPFAEANLTSLIKGTTYYVAPYFTNWLGTFYGQASAFNTEDEKEPPPGNGRIVMMTTNAQSFAFTITAQACTVDWGDGTVKEYTPVNSSVSHSYSDQTVRTVTVIGTDLTRFECNYSSLSSLDVSDCTSLTELRCNYSSLSSLDVSGLTALRTLVCNYNTQLSSLDVSGLTALTWLMCRENQLSSLDVSGLTALNSLDCGSNKLSSLDVSGLTALNSLDCDSNKLSSLDVSGLTALGTLYCRGNQLSIDAFNSIFTSLPPTTYLRSIYCGGNPGYNYIDQSYAIECGWIARS